MPLYMCNSTKGAIPEEAKPKIAADIANIHCEITDAPPTFVHALFLEEAPQVPLEGKTALLYGSIRHGRTEAQKQEIVDRMAASIHRHAGIPLEEILATTVDVPASWVMEGGDILPEPGEEEEWLKAHHAKSA